MGKPRAFATRPLFPEARAILEEYFEFEYWTCADRIPRAELLKRVSSCEALICLITEKIDEELLSAAPKLRTRHVLLVIVVTLVTVAIWSTVIRVYLHARLPHASGPVGRSAQHRAG